MSELGIEKDLVEELNNQGITEPFEIQKITIRLRDLFDHYLRVAI